MNNMNTSSNPALANMVPHFGTLYIVSFKNNRKLSLAETSVSKLRVILLCPRRLGMGLSGVTGPGTNGAQDANALRKEGSRALRLLMSSGFTAARTDIYKNTAKMYVITIACDYIIHK